MRTIKSLTLISAVLVVAALVIVYTALIRPWHMRWGATDEELALSLPGDSFIPRNTIVSTRALTIHAPAAVVWPWLVQLGQGRGGFYSYDWLENLFAADMHNAERILPELQHLQVGDHISLQRNGPFGIVVALEPEQMLVISGGWAFYLRPVDEQSTRLIVRYASFVVDDWFSKLFYYPIFEPAHFVMEAGMMLGIMQRAERLPAPAPAFLPVVREGR
jgi:hypothetical protein